MTRTAKPPVYVVFDRENQAVCDSLQAQARSYDCPFLIVDRPRPPPESKAQPSAEEVKRQMAGACCVLVLCTEETGCSSQIADELALARQLGKPVFLLRGTCKAVPTRPSSAPPDEKIWAFRWCNVRALLAGAEPADDQLVVPPRAVALA